jgi:hypothetical protein
MLGGKTLVSAKINAAGGGIANVVSILSLSVVPELL